MLIVAVSMSATRRGSSLHPRRDLPQLLEAGDADRVSAAQGDQKAYDTPVE